MERTNCKDCGAELPKKPSAARCKQCLKLIKDYKEFIELAVKFRKEKK